MVAAGAGADIVLVGLHLHQPAPGLQVGHNGLAGLIAVHAGVAPIALHHLAAVVQNPDGLQIVPQAHLKVVGVVGGGHFHAAGAKFQVHVLVGHNGHFPAHQGQDALFAHKARIALVGGVDGHAGISQHSLRPGGGHNDILAFLPLDGVADVPEVSGLVLVLHLHVAEGGDAVGTPVDDTGALVDEPLFIEAYEHMPDGLGQPLVHGKAGALPVAGDAHLLLLLHNAGPVLGLPVPHPLQKLLPAQVVPAEALVLPEVFLYLGLRSDPGMITAGDPEGGIALHPLEADEDVLKGAVHGVAHVQLTRHVGGRHDDGKGLFAGVPDAPETPVLLPGGINAALHLLGLINLWQFFFHLCRSTRFLIK